MPRSANDRKMACAARSEPLDQPPDARRYAQVREVLPKATLQIRFFLLLCNMNSFYLFIVCVLFANARKARSGEDCIMLSDVGEKLD